MISSLPLQASDASQRVELEYGWEILIDPTGRLQRDEAERSEGWRSARVGLSWNVQFEDLRDYMGAAWYRTSFELPVFSDTRHVLLKFGAVDYFCEVFLNGTVVGTHEGGYTPFSFEITNAVRPGINSLVVRVIDPPMDEVQNRSLFPEMMYNEIPHGKQNWYLQISGIWQGVRVEWCPGIYIERLDVVPQISGDFELVARLAGVGLTAENGSLANDVKLRAEIYDSNGRMVFETTESLDPASHNLRLKGKVSHPQLWGPENPALYQVEVSLSGAVQYRRRTRFGFRSIEAKDGKLYLNGKPYFMIAALDQDFYPETVHTPGSEESVRDMMEKAKGLGINLLRCHLKVAHPVYMDVADEIGLLIWTELPSWSDCWFPSDHFSSMAAVRAERMFWEILIRDWNHPCIVLQTIMNESWGINLKDASQRNWLRSAYDRVKALLAPLGRLVVDNSACEGNFHLKTDIEDFHQYYSMPDQAEKWNQWLKALAGRPEWTFSPYGDAERTGREPLLVSEFGNWGLPKLPADLPWWFDASFGDREVTRPGGVLERFETYFSGLFENFNEMAEETQWHQFISLKYEIESIRSYESLNGYVITAISDVHWEVNGLMDMWRNEKIYASSLRSLQQPDLILCKLPRYCFRSGENVTVTTLLSHFSNFNLSGARVRWSSDSGSHGQFVLPPEIAPGSVTNLQSIEVRMPEVDGPRVERLELEVRLKNGQRIAENFYDLYVLPPRTSHSEVSLIALGGTQGLATALKSGIYEIGEDGSSRVASDVVMLATQYDKTVAEHLARGGNVVLVAGSESALPASWPWKITLRAGSELDGRWFSNFNWIRPAHKPFSEVAFTRILGFESAQVAPEYVIQGIAGGKFEDVLSGMTLGWLNENCGLAVQTRIGPGKLILTTYRFDNYGDDAYATHLLDALIQYISSPECMPTLELRPEEAVIAGQS